MIEYKCEVTQKLADTLEEYFFELENCPWLLKKEADQLNYELCGYFLDEMTAEEYLFNLRHHFKDLPEEFDVNYLEERDWQDAYKEFLKPWSDRELHWIPIWMKEEYELPAGHVAIYFDAGMAFGTGNHETTQLCAKRLLDIKKTLGSSIGDTSVIDAGCGSGILALSAKKLGFGKIFGFDIDPDAIEVSQENAERNEIKEFVTFKTGDIKGSLEDITTNILVANIEADILCKHSDDLIKTLDNEGFIILSGILSSEIDKVIEHFKSKIPSDWTVESRILGEWADLFIHKNNND